MPTTVATMLLAAATCSGGACVRDPVDRFAERHGFRLDGGRGFVPEAGDAPQGRLLARRAGETLRIRVTENVGPEQARSQRAGHQALLENLVEPQLPPYPEFLTRQTWCPARFHPVRTDAPAGPVFSLPASERLGYGVCADELVRYRASIGLFYCENSRRLARIEHFVPAGTPAGISAVLESFRCL